MKIYVIFLKKYSNVFFKYINLYKINKKCQKERLLNLQMFCNLELEFEL